MFRPAQINHTKGENEPDFDSTVLNKVGLKTSLVALIISPVHAGHKEVASSRPFKGNDHSHYQYSSLVLVLCKNIFQYVSKAAMRLKQSEFIVTSTVLRNLESSQRPWPSLQDATEDIFRCLELN